ncbi:hypothetical protein AAHA92_25693 [Salvia divinorum]|uniref:Uncharacterized protein n=1 Tax=Salvia divinorum TaxID=28513 RepID=A0ABD1GBJ2_SALDI
MNKESVEDFGKALVLEPERDGEYQNSVVFGVQLGHWCGSRKVPLLLQEKNLARFECNEGTSQSTEKDAKMAESNLRRGVRKEELEKKQQQNDDEMGKAREVIRDAVITKDTNCDDDEKQKKNTQKAEDVLAYSRAVNQTDSSLQ